MIPNLGRPRLGLDIGGVLISPSGGSADTSLFGKTLVEALRSPPVDGMFEHVPILVQRFHQEVWLVSKCGPRIQERTLRWLDHHQFYQRTSIPRENVRFCRTRPEKADHCRELGITHFLDDRADVLGHLEPVVPFRYLFGPQDSRGLDQHIRRLANWAEVTDTVLFESK